MYEKIATCFFISDREARLIFLSKEFENNEKQTFKNSSVENCKKNSSIELPSENEIKPIYYM